MILRRHHRAWAGGGLGFEGTGVEAPAIRRPAMRHGTRHGYDHGCPCDPCGEAGRIYYRERNAARRSAKRVAS